MTRRHEELPDVLRPLVEAELRRPPLDGAALDALVTRVRGAVSQGQSEGGVGGESVVGPRRTPWWRWVQPALFVGLGVVIGVMVDPWRRREVRTVTRVNERVVERAVERVVVVAPDGGGAPVAVVQGATTPRPAAGAANEALSLGWIERASQAVRDGNGDEAARWLTQHRVRFPRGPHLERRMLLEVDAAFLLGRYDQTRRAGRLFIERFPDSVYRARVEDTLRRAGEEPRARSEP